MTFHGRLRLFFAIIVIVPMLAIAAVLFFLTAGSERGKADARIATGLRVGISLYGEGHADALDDLKRLGNDDGLQRALSSRDTEAARTRLAQVVRADRRIVSATLFDVTGNPVARAGLGRGVAAFSAFLQAGGKRLGSLAVSVTDARELARLAARRTRIEFAFLRNGQTVATTVPRVRTFPGRSGAFEAGGREYRGRRVTTGRLRGVREEIVAFRDAGETNSAISASRVRIGIIIIAFLLLALATSVFVVRALQGQVGTFLEAARRLAGGRFDQPVPTSGSDEFAQLGREFNRMSKQLEANIREVERKRRELQEAIRHVGKAIASGLERQSILDLTVQTAVRACEAEVGRAWPLDSRLLLETRAGVGGRELGGALEEAERAAFKIGPETGGELLGPWPDGGRANRRGPIAVERGGVHALALPLSVQLGSRADPSNVGVVSIARHERPFTAQESELLEYLIGQASVSIENAYLHETVRRQAITDDLTGLPNRRKVRGTLAREFDRHRRFKAPLGFVALDIDDFKSVNDTHGHQQGDKTLVQVAQVLRALTRDIDEAGRDTNGEEFAVVLPQTDMDDATVIAERMREAIEQLRVPRLEGGEPVRVTASFGVAAAPASAADEDSLIAAADAALFRAKRAGKNRVERAPDL